MATNAKVARQVRNVQSVIIPKECAPWLAMNAILPDSGHMICRVVFALLLVASLALSAQAQRRDPWAPMEECVFGMPYLGHAISPQQKGSLNEIFKLIFKPEDILFRHERMPYDRALEEVVAGKIDVTLDIASARKGAIPSKMALATYDLSVVYHFKTEFKNLQSLKGKRVAFLHGFAVDKRLGIPFVAYRIYDLASGYHLLNRGLIDYLLGDNVLLMDAMIDSQLPPGHLIMKHITSFHVRPVFTDSDKGRKLREMYDRRIEEILASGDLEYLMRDLGRSDEAIRKILEANK